MKFRKNDKVIILSGKDKGKTGKIVQVFPKEDKVVVEGLNVRYKHMRPRKQGEKGQRIDFSAPLTASRLMLVCPKCGRNARIAKKILENKASVRVCNKCKDII